MWTRLKALIVKELLAVLRDPRGRMVLIVPPIMQLFIFAYAATMEVKNVDIAVLNRDGGRWSYELIARLQGAPTFKNVTMVDNPQGLHDAINMQRALLAVQIGPQFSSNVEARRPSDVQVILDGRRSNASQLAGGYVAQIVAGLGADVVARSPEAALAAEPIVPRFWFNPALDTQWFMVPILIAVIAVLIGLVVTGLSIARERELGTFDQLMVSPLRTHEIIGKAVPPLIIGYFHCTFYLLAALFWFGLPLRGSLVLFYAGVFFYLLALIGIGLFLSALSATQQQAILGAFLFMIPATLTSGFATPIDNMPQWLQTATIINPLRYFIRIVRGVFLKGLPFDEFVHNIIPLCLIAVVTLASAAFMFRRRME